MRLKALKVGVMNTGSGRMDEHRRNGWEPLVLDGEPSVWPVATGSQAQSIEDAVLRIWRERLNAGIAVKADDMPQGGFTETAALTLVDPTAAMIDIATMVQALASGAP